jgi:dTDP-4-amino-4,6-dideoxygalactose transaminase
MSGKHMATGAQGGIVFTPDEELHWKAKRFADRGKPFNLPEAGSNVVAGLNLNSNELSAAIGRVQLRKLPGIVERRRRAGDGVKEGLRELATVSVGWQPPDSECSYWFLRIGLELERLSVSKEDFVEALVAEGIPAATGYRHIQAESTWWTDRHKGWCPWLCRDRGAKAPELPNAIAVTDRHFNVSIHEGYGDEEVQDIVEALARLERAFLA